MKQKTKENKVAVPKEFMKILKDFYVDIFTTFPECKEKVDKDLIVNLMEEKGESVNVKELHNYCSTLYPQKFFDILYENVDIFTDASYNAFFLPDIDFKKLWGVDISDNTKFKPSFFGMSIPQNLTCCRGFATLLLSCITAAYRYHC